MLRASLGSWLLKELRKVQEEAGSVTRPPAVPVQTAWGQTPLLAATQVVSAAPAAGALSSGEEEERFTFTRAELEALLADREARVRREGAKPEA